MSPQLTPPPPASSVDEIPLWSVMVPTFNPTAHLRETLLAARAALIDCAAGSQLEIVDDASSLVDIEALLRSWGLSDIPVHRRATNGGLGACWNSCIERAKGRLIHILHQDDLIKPSFYSRMGRLAQECPQAGMLFCRSEFLIDASSHADALEQIEAGPIAGWLDKISAGQRLQCPSVVVRRETYARVGLFEPALRYVIDWEMWVRIAACSEVAYLPEALAIYRIHSSAQTSKIRAAGIATRDYAAGFKHVKRTLMLAGRADCVAAAAAFVMESSLHTAHEAERVQRPEAAAREVYSSLRHFGRLMPRRRLYWHAKWYLKLRLASLLQRRPQL